LKQISARAMVMYAVCRLRCHLANRNKTNSLNLVGGAGRIRRSGSRHFVPSARGRF